IAAGVLLCIPAAALAQGAVTPAQDTVSAATHTRYIVEGTINNLSAPATMYIRHYKDKVTSMDSVVLKNGFYHFEGKYEPDEQTYMGLSFSGKGWTSLRRAREVYL